MRRFTLPAIGLLLWAVGAAAQPATPAPRGAAGLFLSGDLSGTTFSVERIVTMVGYFLPPGENAANSPQRGGAAGGQAGEDTGGGFRVFRLPEVDARYYLTAAQIDRLLPLLEDLHENPYPSPSAARRIQGGVDETMTRDQKREWESFVKIVEEQMKRPQSQAAAFQNATPEQRAAIAQRRAQGDGAEGAPAARELDPEEIRRRTIDGLIRRMTARRESL